MRYVFVEMGKQPVLLEKKNLKRYLQKTYPDYEIDGITIEGGCFNHDYPRYSYVTLQKQEIRPNVAKDNRAIYELCEEDAIPNFHGVHGVTDEDFIICKIDENKKFVNLTDEEACYLMSQFLLPFSCLRLNY